jgi:hypothetical protein
MPDGGVGVAGVDRDALEDLEDDNSGKGSDD